MSGTVSAIDGPRQRRLTSKLRLVRVRIEAVRSHVVERSEDERFERAALMPPA